VDSVLDDVEVSLLETRLPVQKGSNFSFIRWNFLKFLQEFPHAIFLGVDVESLLSEADVSSLHIRVPV
jgi:hypothetical protein